MKTTKRIAITAVIGSSVVMALMAWITWGTWFQMPWWSYLVLWLLGIGIWYGSEVKDKARENLANMYDRE